MSDRRLRELARKWRGGDISVASQLFSSAYRSGLIEERWVGVAAAAKLKCAKGCRLPMWGWSQFCGRPTVKLETTEELYYYLVTIGVIGPYPDATPRKHWSVFCKLAKKEEPKLFEFETTTQVAKRYLERILERTLLDSICRAV